MVLPAVPDAREHLARLVLIYRRGQRAPLPLFPETSYAYVEDLRKRRKKNAPSAEARDAAALEKALVKWDGGDYVGASPGECERPAARLVWGGALPWEIAGVGPLGFRELAVAVFDPIAALVGDGERTR
jgi:exonuclease V gamma subunit